MEIDRRRFIKVALFTAVGMAAAIPGCSGSKPPIAPIMPISTGPAKGPYSLTEQGEILTDGRVDYLQHPYLEAVSFFFDPKRAGGSLVMDLMLRMGAEFRLITEETDSVLPTNPGFIYCMPSLESPGPLRQFPVIRFKPEEAYLISMGFKASGEDCIKSYERMWTYSVARDLNGILNGRFEGVRTFNPADPNLKPRDAEAMGYFRKDCVS